MVNPSTSSMARASGTREKSSTPAACEACRKSKMRCIRSNPGNGATGSPDQCDRCKRNMRECKIPQPRPLGRRHGSVGKYRGVEKAVRKMKSELQKAQASTAGSSNLSGLSGVIGEEEILELLQKGSSEPRQESPPHRSNVPTDRPASDTFPDPAPPNETVPTSSSVYPDLPLTSNVTGPNAPDVPLFHQDRGTLAPEQPTSAPMDEHRPSHQNEDPISNPLGLVADAYGEAQANERHSMAASSTPVSTQSALDTLNDPEHGSLAHRLLRRSGYISLGLKIPRRSLELGLDALFTHPGLTGRYSNYFKPADASKPPDTGPDVDPVDLGLVTMEEAHALFPIYFARLHPFNGILDPILHTPEFVRSRSALLFTWILAITAQFDSTHGSAAKRLRLHGENLSKLIHSNAFRSVEIAQGYYISLLSATPARTLSEERSSVYTNYAFAMAAELVLDHQSQWHSQSTRPTRPSSPNSLLERQENSSFRPVPPNIGPFDSNSSKDPYYNSRLVRNRERTWLRILLWERAHSSSRGRMNAFPEMELTRRVEEWWQHPLAHNEDKHTCAFILLRRQLALIHEELERQAELPHTDSHWVRDLIDSSLHQWRTTWLSGPESFISLTDQISRVFLRYVFMHGRLWTLAFALHGPTARHADVNSLREDCFEAAIDCCETAVRDLQEIGEPLYCMLGPTWAMISYAAVLALKLFPTLYGKRVGYEVELLALISQVALQLETAGTTPPHRFGIAALLGQHLFLILRSRAGALKDWAKSGKGIESQEVLSTDHWLNSQLAGFEMFPHEHQSSETSGHNFAYDPLLAGFNPFHFASFSANDEHATESVFGCMIGEWFGQGFPGII